MLRHVSSSSCPSEGEGGKRGGKRALPWHRHLSRADLDRVFPDLSARAAVGAIEYWDATVDDARYVTTLVRTAAGYGAQAATRIQVVELTKNGAGVVDGALLRDLETDRVIAVKARHVISSTGVWTEQSQALAGETGGLRVLASKDIHIVVLTPPNNIAYFNCLTAVIVRELTSQSLPS